MMNSCLTAVQISVSPQLVWPFPSNRTSPPCCDCGLPAEGSAVTSQSQQYRNLPGRHFNNNSGNPEIIISWPLLLYSCHVFYVSEYVCSFSTAGIISFKKEKSHLVIILDGNILIVIIITCIGLEVLRLPH